MSINSPAYTTKNISHSVAIPYILNDKFSPHFPPNKLLPSEKHEHELFNQTRVATQLQSLWPCIKATMTLRFRERLRVPRGFESSTAVNKKAIYL